MGKRISLQHPLLGILERTGGCFLVRHACAVVTEELDEAAETFREWEESYPRDDVAPNNFGNLYGLEGRYEPAVEQTQKALRLNPENVIAYDNLAQCSLALNRFDDGRKTYDEAMGRKLDDDVLHLVRYGIAFRESDSKVMSEQAAWFADRPEVQNEMLALEAETEGYAGHLNKARELTRRAWIQRCERTTRRGPRSGNWKGHSVKRFSGSRMHGNKPPRR
jgi:tetratricopeptide (TPR) repeat protein